jgi:hypothetical protein
MVRTIVAAILALLAMSGTGFAQNCLHEGSESAEQQSRRRLAIAAARAINTLQHRSRSLEKGGVKLTASPTFQTLMQLSTLPSNQIPQVGTPPMQLSFAPNTDLIPGWRLKLELTTGSESRGQGYWFVISDTTDPCGFSIFSNNDGVIFNATPLR